MYVLCSLYNSLKCCFALLYCRQDVKNVFAFNACSFQLLGWLFSFYVWNKENPNPFKENNYLFGIKIFETLVRCRCSRAHWIILCKNIDLQTWYIYNFLHKYDLLEYWYIYIYIVCLFPTVTFSKKTSMCLGNI